MLRFLVKRTLTGVLVLFGVVLITFTMTRIVPSDPASKWVGPRATPEQIAEARIELGLDKPVYFQFGKYLSDLLRGDLGYSLRTHQPVSEEMKTFIPATIELVLVATVLAVLIGLPLGLYSAKYKNKYIDHISRFVSVGAVSLPSFWVAMALQLIFFGWLALFPIGGRVSTITAITHKLPHITGLLVLDSLLTGNWYVFKDALLHIILPAIPVSLYPIGLIARQTRSALLEILNEDYITAGRSYGLKEGYILWRYALKNSLGPTVTVICLSTGYTLVNTFLIESIFSWPGIGKYIATAVSGLDYPAIMAVTLFSAFCYLVLNMVADIIIALDPRVRL